MDLKAGYVLLNIGIFGLYALLIGLMPAQFFYSFSMQEILYPEYFTTIEIGSVAYLEENTITEYSETLVQFGAGLPEYYVYWHYLEPDIQISYIYWRFLFLTSSEDCTFYTMQGESLGTVLTKAELSTNWNDEQNVTRLTCKSSRSPNMRLWFSDNDTSRNDIELAYDDGKLDLAMGLGIDDLEASFSGWDLIAKLLTFQQVEGMPNYLLYPINLFLYGLTAYNVVCLLTKFIPFGGG